MHGPLNVKICFVTMPAFTVRSCKQLSQPPGQRTTPCRLRATAYLIHSAVLFILEAVPSSATLARTLP
jgi:hypothetical protein